jgi:hypothetical protein
MVFLLTMDSRQVVTTTNPRWPPAISAWVLSWSMPPP